MKPPIIKCPRGFAYGYVADGTGEVGDFVHNFMRKTGISDTDLRNQKEGFRLNTTSLKKNPRR